METRKFIVVDNRSNRTLEYQSSANTFGELRNELSARGFDLSNTEIQEGFTKTILSNDPNGILPRDVVYHNVVQNSLIFRITQARSKTKSGAMTRAEAYQFIKSNNMEDTIRNKYGKSFTNCRTQELVDAIIANNTPTTPCCTSSLEKAFRMLVGELYNRGIISLSTEQRIYNALGKPEDTTPAEETVGGLTMSEIEELFVDM